MDSGDGSGCQAPQRWPSVSNDAGAPTPWNALTPSNLSFAPIKNVAVIWLDQQTGANFPPRLQRWGQRFTVPAGVGTTLNWASLYVQPDSGNKAATFFEIRLTRWSDALQQPTGPILYQSEAIRLADPNPNPPDPTFQIRPTVFEMHVAVTAGQQYFIEIAGDGVVGMALTNASAGDGLYLTQDCTPWSLFGEQAVRSDLAFE
jgi:hypothetical protein